MAQGSIIIGRGVRVEVSKQFGLAIPLTEVSNADPAVATTTAAHTLQNKSVGYFTGVTGMVQLEGQAVRISAAASPNFTCPDLDTSKYPDFTGGSFIPVTEWSTLEKSTSISEGGGDAEQLDVGVLLDDIKKVQNGLLADETISINLLAETLSSEASRIVRKAARNSELLVFRVTWKTGDTLCFTGEPSKPGRDVQKGQVGTGSLKVSVKGTTVEGAA